METDKQSNSTQDKGEAIQAHDNCSLHRSSITSLVQPDGLKPVDIKGYRLKGEEGMQLSYNTLFLQMSTGSKLFYSHFSLHTMSCSIQSLLLFLAWVHILICTSGMPPPLSSISLWFGVCTQCNTMHSVCTELCWACTMSCM